MSKLTVKRMVSTRIPTAEGEFQLILYDNDQDKKEHLALVMGDIEGKSNVLVRVHSECFTGDVLGSRRCDCGEQLHRAMKMIAAAGEGAVIYLRQEGRGIGLLDKLRAYNLQDAGYDTVDANIILGHQADERDYTIAARILEDLGVKSVSLMTNNPAKIEHLRKLGIRVKERVKIEAGVYADNFNYLLTKVQRMNHLLNLDPVSIPADQSKNLSL
jgi:GTP cyclohydrolase II